MEVKTENGGTFDAAGKGTTGLSIAGLVTGATALVGGGLLNFLGMNSNGNSGRKNCKDFVTKEDLNEYEKYDNLFSTLEREKSERYTDQAIIAYNKDKFEFNKSIADAIIQDRERISALEQKNACFDQIMALKEENFNLKLETLKDKMFAGDAIEAERRMNGDQNLYNYAKSTFVPGKLVMPSDSICPEVMPRYNSYTAPTNG